MVQDNKNDTDGLLVWLDESISLDYDDFSDIERQLINKVRNISRSSSSSKGFESALRGALGDEIIDPVKKLYGLIEQSTFRDDIPEDEANATYNVFKRPLAKGIEEQKKWIDDTWEKQLLGEILEAKETSDLDVVAEKMDAIPGLPQNIKNEIDEQIDEKISEIQEETFSNIEKKIGRGIRPQTIRKNLIKELEEGDITAEQEHELRERIDPRGTLFSDLNKEIFRTTTPAQADAIIQEGIEAGLSKALINALERAKSQQFE